MLHPANEVVLRNERPEAAVGICIQVDHLTDDELLEPCAVLPICVTILQLVHKVATRRADCVGSDGNV